jgi:hypothetical protein
VSSLLVFTSDMETDIKDYLIVIRRILDRETTIKSSLFKKIIYKKVASIGCKGNFFSKQNRPGRKQELSFRPVKF